MKNLVQKYKFGKIIHIILYLNIANIFESKGTKTTITITTIHTNYATLILLLTLIVCVSGIKFIINLSHFDVYVYKSIKFKIHIGVILCITIEICHYCNAN